MASYYVDATLGDDSNPGTQTQPWRTVSKVNSTSFSAGDNIYFKRGETWRETLNVPSSGSDGNPITFGAYGNGDSPIITALEVVDSDDWSGPDENGEYTCSIATACVIFAEDGEFIPEGTAGSLSTGEWDYDSDTNTLYYKPSSGTPSDHITERGERERAILIYNRSYITFRNLDVRGNNHPQAFRNCIDAVGTGNNITIDNCLVKIAYVAGICFGPDISDSTVQNTEVTQCTGKGVWLRGSNLKVSNCHIHHIGQGNLIATHDREGVAMAGSDNMVEHCIIHNCGHPTVGDSSSGFGVVCCGGTGGHCVKYNLIYNIDHIGISFSDSNDKAYYNVIYQCGIKATADNGWFGGIKAGGNYTGIEIYNNVVYNCEGNTTANPQQNSAIALWANTGETLEVTIKNNIIAENQTDYDLAVVEAGTINLVSDYNCWYRSSPGSTFKYDGSNMTFSEYQSASGQDQHSIAQNPSFVDADNGNFRLKVGSPCIDAGTDVNLDRDFDYNPVPWGAGVDIGAFELIRRITVLSLSRHLLDVRSGGWVDLSRFGNHGTPYGGVRPHVIAPEIMGFNFDGSTGYVDCGDNPSLSCASEITILAWIKTSRSDADIISKWTSASGKRGYRIRIQNGRLRFDDTEDGAVETYWGATGSVSINDNVWHCVGASYNGDKLVLYVDRIMEEFEKTNTLFAGSGRLSIGRQGEDSTGYFKQFIAEPIIVNAAWSQAEFCEYYHRSPIYRMLRGLPHSMMYTKVPWKQQEGIYIL
ncbi:MAG: hypothetical protein DRJ03_25070 [Chloroflexi bacterium]|nr:MAG: hypothetical protein DRJ03_25070 [Chloroflexota bacterium]